LIYSNDSINAMVAAEIGNVYYETGYFKESVGRYLLGRWRQDPSDARIIEYVLPVVESRVRMSWSRLHTLPVECEDMIHDVAMDLLPYFNRYDESKGNLFNYLTTVVIFKVMGLPDRYADTNTVGVDDMTPDEWEVAPCGPAEAPSVATHQDVLKHVEGIAGAAAVIADEMRSGNNTMSAIIGAIVLKTHAARPRAAKAYHDVMGTYQATHYQPGRTRRRDK